MSKVKVTIHFKDDTTLVIDNVVARDDSEDRAFMIFTLADSSLECIAVSEIKYYVVNEITEHE